MQGRARKGFAMLLIGLTVAGGCTETPISGDGNETGVQDQSTESVSKGEDAIEDLARRVARHEKFEELLRAIETVRVESHTRARGLNRIELVAVQSLSRRIKDGYQPSDVEVDWLKDKIGYSQPLERRVLSALKTIRKDIPETDTLSAADRERVLSLAIQIVGRLSPKMGKVVNSCQYCDEVYNIDMQQCSIAYSLHLLNCFWLIATTVPYLTCVGSAITIMAFCANAAQTKWTLCRQQYNCDGGSTTGDTLAQDVIEKLK